VAVTKLARVALAEFSTLFVVFKQLYLSVTSVCELLFQLLRNFTSHDFVMVVTLLVAAARTWNIKNVYCKEVTVFRYTTCPCIQLTFIFEDEQWTHSAENVKLIINWFLVFVIALFTTHAQLRYRMRARIYSSSPFLFAGSKDAVRSRERRQTAIWSCFRSWLRKGLCIQAALTTSKVVHPSESSRFCAFMRFLMQRLVFV